MAIDHSHKHDHHHAGSGCSHEHFHHHAVSANIGFAFILNLSFSLIEFVGGAAIGSMAIMANAVHDLGDSVSLGLAWLLERLANRAQDQSFNFGYRRFSLLSALISGVIISIGSAVIIYEAIESLRSDVKPPSGWAVSMLAVLGVAVNAIAAWRLSRGSTQNERMLTWHQVQDMAGWAIVLFSGIVIAVFQTNWLDPMLAIFLALFVLYNVLRYLKQTAYLFLQGRPADFEAEIFTKEVLAIPGIEHIDQLAVWSLDGRHNILSARLHLHTIHEPVEIEHAKAEVRKIAARHGAVATLETCLASLAHD